MSQITGRLWEEIQFRLPVIFDKDSKLHYRFVRDRRKRNRLKQIAGRARSVDFVAGEWIIETELGRLALRDDGSDVDVFWQVLHQKEYRTVVDTVSSNGVEVKTIVDAGGNIGLTTLYLGGIYPEAKIYSIEPDPGNFNRLLNNAASLGPRLAALRKAVWSRDEEVFLHDDFRDGLDWARNVSTEATASSVPGVSINTLIDEFSIEAIDILKMDIEGGEAEVFGENADVSFLGKTKLIAMEIHDEFGCREAIGEILRRYGFILYLSGELTVAVNTHLVAASRRSRVAV